MPETAKTPNPSLFYPPHAAPLTGQESFVVSTWKFLRNPLEGFGPLAYSRPIVSLETFGYKTHVISDPEGMKQVLSVQADKFTKTPIDARILGPATKEGLLSVHGDQWKRQRRVVAPIFRPRHIENLAPIVGEVISGFKSGLASRSSVELNGAMADITFDVLSKALLGDPQGIDRQRLRRATRKVVTSAGTLRPDDLLPMPRWMPRPLMPSGYAALRRLKKAAEALLKTQSEQSAQDDLIGLLTQSVDPKTGEALTDREKRDNLIGFFIAGHETTALTLTWALYLVAKHPPTMRRIREEVLQVCGQGDVSYDKIGDLTFTQAVIHETVRLYPPAPILNRECHAPAHVLGRDIAPNDILILNNYIMHRTERLWEDPLAFDPDRFLRDPSLTAKGSAFMPFGAGPRICVGAAFANMEAMMVLASLVRDYDVSLPEDCFPRPLMTVTLRPEGGLPTKFKKVDRN